MQLQEFLWVDFIFRHINSSKIYSEGFLSTWRPNRKSFENQAHFVSLSETSVHYLLCALVKLATFRNLIGQHLTLHSALPEHEFSLEGARSARFLLLKRFQNVRSH